MTASLAKLTRRQREMLPLIAEGLTNAEIADRLFIAEQTVKDHVMHLFAATGMNRVQLACWYARLQEREAVMTERERLDAACAWLRSETAA